MTDHWLHVTLSWLLAFGGFGALAVGAALRHRAAASRLRRLDPRGREAA